MQPVDFDLGPGRVVYWDLGGIGADLPLSAQVELLKEDLAQIVYEGGIVVDVGWYPDGAWEGTFRVSVVRDGDWDQPLFVEDAATIGLLRAAVARAAAVAASGVERG